MSAPAIMGLLLMSSGVVLYTYNDVSLTTIGAPSVCLPVLHIFTSLHLARYHTWASQCCKIPCCQSYKSNTNEAFSAITIPRARITQLRISKKNSFVIYRGAILHMKLP